MNQSPPNEKLQHGADTASNLTETGGATVESIENAQIYIDPKAEARLRRKIDWMIVPTVCLLYLFCFIDRANIGNARLAGLEEDLGMTGNDYNLVLSTFYVSYILFEIPANLLCKYVGPGWFIPATSLGFGLSSIFTAFVTDVAQICGVRFVLGIFEAGMLPGIAYYMSRWYRRSELTFRLSLYIVMAPLAGAFGGLLVSAILTLETFGRFRDWQMIFAIEGIITVGLALISFATLTDRPETAMWLTDQEKKLAVDRIKAERLATTEVLDKIDMAKILAGIRSPLTLSTSVIFLLDNITVQGLAFFLPTIVRTIYPERSTISQQLFTVPPYVVGAFFTVLLPGISYKVDRRQILIILCAPLVMVGYAIFLGTTNAQARYGATFLVASSAFALGPLTNSQISANVLSDTARSSAIGTNVMFGNIGGLVSTWSFVRSDAPNYPIGNGLNLATSSSILVLGAFTLWWIKRDNRKRDSRSVEAELAGLSLQEIQDLDWKHPGFRWLPLWSRVCVHTLLDDSPLPLAFTSNRLSSFHIANTTGCLLMQQNATQSAMATHAPQNADVSPGEKTTHDGAVHNDHIERVETGTNNDAVFSKFPKMDKVDEFGAHAKTDPREIALVKKLDRYIIPMLWFMYLFNYLDRNALINARLNNLEEDLGLEGTQYNTCVSILFVGYITGQVPSNMLLNRVRPSWYMAGFCLAWSIVSLLTFLANDYSSMVALRFVLGVTEAPFYPGAIYIISMFYTRKEMAVRLAIFYTGNMFASSFSGLIAAGIFAGLDQTHGLAGWQWLFIIQGALSIVTAILAFIFLPDHPLTTRWLSEEQRQLAHNRIFTDTTDVREKTSVWTGLREAATDWRTWAMCLMYNLHLSSVSFQNFLPTVMGTLGYSRTITLVLTCPPYLLAASVGILIAWTSGRWNERTWHITICKCIVMVGFIIPAATFNLGARMFSIFLFVGFSFGINNLLLAWISATVGQTNEKKSVSLAICNTFGNLASVYTPYLWPASDEPRYLPAWIASIAFSIGVVVIAWGLKIHLQRQNKKTRRDHPEVTNFYVY
ncbi:hypothetical protein F66182_3422 [Fusarium sp. NRRL 66182]|nr:hypothetical protein F66182_3422 [Fusarium sp. NRRL 66182]